MSQDYALPRQKPFLHRILSGSSDKEPCDPALRQDTVKYCVAHKAYGFIYDASTRSDVYFHFMDATGPERPREGDLVSYRRIDGPRGAHAEAVQVVTSREAQRYAKCARCGRHMVPRVLTFRGSVEGSVCPFCFAAYKSILPSWASIAVRLAALAFIFWIVSIVGAPSHTPDPAYSTPPIRQDLGDTDLTKLLHHH